MRALVVDARAAYGSGLGRYMRETVTALAGLGRFGEIALAGDPRELEPLRSALGVRVIPFARRRYDPAVPFAWRGVARAMPADHVTWFPHWDGAWGASGAVTTLHDLIAFEGAGPRAVLRRAVARAWISRMVGASRVVITGSEHTRAQICAVFPDAARKLRVIHHGVAPVFFRARAGAPAASGGEWGGARSGAPYLLAVANKKPHKNLAMAIRAFAVLARDDRTLRLKLVGQRFPHAGELMGIARALGVGDRVDDIAGVPDEDLAQLYRYAEAVLVTSRVEGFGMVALEAMAAGVPVVAVDRDPLPEVVGTAAVRVALDDADAMAAAVHRLRTDPAHRADRIGAGHTRAAQFTWERSAAQTADALLSGGP
jgi:glycosyltransferase involved in cell wall biosynthesis